MQTRKRARVNYAPSSDDCSTIHSSEEKEYNSEATEIDEKPNSQDRGFITGSSMHSEMSFLYSSDQTEDEVFMIQCKAPITVPNSKVDVDLIYSCEGSTQDSDYSDVVYIGTRKKN